jgi:hypothetical protein
MKPEMLSLDAIAADPNLAASLQPQDQRRVLLLCATIQSAIAASFSSPTSIGTREPERMLDAEQAAGRMGKTVWWMKRQGRLLPFARRVGRSWGWVESGLDKWLIRRA